MTTQRVKPAVFTKRKIRFLKMHETLYKNIVIYKACICLSARSSLLSYINYNIIEVSIHYQIKRPPVFSQVDYICALPAQPNLSHTGKAEFLLLSYFVQVATWILYLKICSKTPAKHVAHFFVHEARHMHFLWFIIHTNLNICTMISEVT